MRYEEMCVLKRFLTLLLELPKSVKVCDLVLQCDYDTITVLNNDLRQIRCLVNAMTWMLPTDGDSQPCKSNDLYRISCNRTGRTWSSEPIMRRPSDDESTHSLAGELAKFYHESDRKFAEANGLNLHQPTSVEVQTDTPANESASPPVAAPESSEEDPLPCIGSKPTTETEVKSESRSIGIQKFDGHYVQLAPFTSYADSEIRNNPESYDHCWVDPIVLAKIVKRNPIDVSQFLSRHPNTIRSMDDLYRNKTVYNVSDFVTLFQLRSTRRLTRIPDNSKFIDMLKSGNWVTVHALAKEIKLSIHRTYTLARRSAYASCRYQDTSLHNSAILIDRKKFLKIRQQEQKLLEQRRGGIPHRCKKKTAKLVDTK